MEVWEDLRREVIAEDPDPKKFEPYVEPDQPGYYHAREYVDRTASWLQRFGVLPEAGGLNDQALTWVKDMERRFAMKTHIAKEYYRDKKPDEGLS